MTRCSGIRRLTEEAKEEHSTLVPAEEKERQSIVYSYPDKVNESSTLYLTITFMPHGMCIGQGRDSLSPA